MPSEKDNVLELNEYTKLHKMPYIVHADLESLIKKIFGCANNTEKFSTTKLVSIKIIIFPVYIHCQHFGHLII